MQHVGWTPRTRGESVERSATVGAAYDGIGQVSWTVPSFKPTRSPALSPVPETDPRASDPHTVAVL